MGPSTIGGPYPLFPRSERVTVLYLMSNAVQTTLVTLLFAAIHKCTKNPHLSSLHALHYVSVATISPHTHTQKKLNQNFYQGQ